MFDIGFFEILLVSVVALLVLGPERLPGAVRTAGLWIGRLKRSFNNIKRDIEKEIGADEIRRQLRNEAIMEKFDNTKTQFTKTIDSVKSQTEAVTKDLDLKKQFDAVAGIGKVSTDKASTKTETNAEENSILSEPSEPAAATTGVKSDASPDVSSETKPQEQK